MALNVGESSTRYVVKGIMAFPNASITGIFMPRVLLRSEGLCWSLAM